MKLSCENLDCENVFTIKVKEEQVVRRKTCSTKCSREYIKESRRKYNKRNYVRVYQKKYRERPKVKQKQKEYQKKHNLKKKLENDKRSSN